MFCIHVSSHLSSSRRSLASCRQKHHTSHVRFTSACFSRTKWHKHLNVRSVLTPNPAMICCKAKWEFCRCWKWEIKFSSICAEMNHNYASRKSKRIALCDGRVLFHNRSVILIHKVIYFVRMADSICIRIALGSASANNIIKQQQRLTLDDRGISALIANGQPPAVIVATFRLSNRFASFPVVWIHTLTLA